MKERFVVSLIFPDNVFRMHALRIEFMLLEHDVAANLFIICGIINTKINIQRVVCP